MIRNNKVLALIPARSGSKGLPGKNIINLGEKPLIAWSIDHAKGSKYIDRTIVSTDSGEIAEIALSLGADVPFIRPSELSTDSASSIDVINHCIDELGKFNHFYDILVYLEPTSPLRESIDIDNAIDLLIATPAAESIVGVCRAEACHPAFLTRVQENYLIPYNKNGFKFLRRQEIDELYFFEGSLYIAHIASIKQRQSFYHEKCLAYRVPKWKSFEIDDITDFVIVEALFKAKNKKII